MAKKENLSSPKWLKKLQLNSWEPEILLSGIVLYGMFQLPGMLDQFLYFFKVNFNTQTTDVDNFIAIMKMAVYWLTAGLIAHLISRGIWVGMVGLSFTFPKGINSEKLKLQDKYKEFVERIPDTEKIILNLESISSALFSISFMMFMIMVGGYFYLLITIIVPVVSLLYFSPGLFDGEIAGKIVAGFILFVLAIGFIGLIDFLTLGFFKRFKWLSKIYWPFYRFIGAITLARFYRPIYYILITNIKGWKIALFLLFFVGTSLWSVTGNNSKYPGEKYSSISLWSDSQATGAFSGYYDDQIEDIRSVVASIQSDIIRGNTIRLFVVMQASLEDSVKKHCNLDSLYKIDGLGSAEARLQCLTNFYTIAIDDSVVADLSYKFHYKSKTEQKGLLAYVDISELRSGLHQLTISLPEEMYKGRSQRVANIPFYKEESFVPYYLADPEKDENDTQPYLKLKPILPK